MSKGLEAYKELKNTMLSSATNFTFESLIRCSDKRMELDECVEKELKALEIIKEKNVFVWGFIHRQEETEDFEPTYEYYKSHYGYFHSGYTYELLTQEEYELLKEVLL